MHLLITLEKKKKKTTTVKCKLRTQTCNNVK